MDDENWLMVAMEDDSLVVDLLLRLNQARPSTPMADSFPSPLPIDWTLRQRRSKQVPKHVEPKTTTEPARASPTTPLSWSGGTSASGGAADGFEESSRPVKSSDDARSKIEVKNAITTTTKRSKRKKTLAELKEEESLLLKESNHLKTVLASLRLNLKNERARNQILKKLKIDLKTKTMHNPAPNATTNVGCNNVDAQNSDQSCSKSLEVGGFGSAIILPDLNLPLEENSGSAIVYRARY